MDCTGGHSEFAIRPDVGTSMSAAHASGVAALVIASGVAGGDPTRTGSRSGSSARRARARRSASTASGLLDAARAVDPSRDCDRAGRLAR